ncbi:hypothetical protein FRC10_010173, partial [Ceratobasidium sp. 414]
SLYEYDNNNAPGEVEGPDQDTEGVSVLPNTIAPMAEDEEGAEEEGKEGVDAREEDEEGVDVGEEEEGADAGEEGKDEEFDHEDMASEIDDEALDDGWDYLYRL